MSGAILPAPSLRRQALRAGLVCALLLVGCTTVREAPAPPLSAQLAALRAEVAAGRAADAAPRFEALATLHPEQAALLHALAADAWLQAAARPAAEAALGRARALPTDGEGAAAIAIVVAELARLDGDPDAALRALAFDAREVSAPLRARLLGLRATVEVALGTPLVAVLDLVVRGALLEDEPARAANAQRLWRILVGAHGELSRAALPLNSPPQAHAWVELALHARGAWADPSAARAAIEAWRDANREHPATSFVLPGLLEQLAHTDRYPAKVALLLPFSGRFAEPAAAVRDGFLAAHFAAGALPEVQVFDTTDYPGGATQALQAAQRWDAGFVVGPLTREAVAELAALGAPPAGLLALNYLDAGAGTPERFWQFGLAPEAEAEAVAERAIAQGLLRAVALHPGNDWGTRLAGAFRARYEALGGTPLAVEAYDATVSEKDFSASIMHALNLDESELRTNLLAAALGQKLESEPRRRRDVDVLFVAARDRDAPLLRAQLRFHRAADIPTFATSAVYRGDLPPQTDLDGLEFADMPWTISLEPAIAAQRERLTALWPDGMARQARLYALGIDAYRLVPLFANLPAPLAEPVTAATGTLTLAAGQRVRRDPFWARFVDGRPAPIVAPRVEPDQPPKP